MKFLYVNINGIKSKITSTNRIIEELEPELIAIVESKMGEDEPLELKNYEIFRNDRDKDGGGVLIAVKENIVKTITDVRKEKQHEESIWIDIDGKKKYRIGVIYMPQEDQTTTPELKKIYNRMSKEISEAGKENRTIILMGDFNCKVGKAIEGNKDTVSKGGKILMKMIEEENLSLVNNLKVCKGKWTWHRRMKESGIEKKSIIDYFIVNEEFSSAVTQALIDEEKEYTPFRRQTKGEDGRVYSDHRSIIVDMKSAINDHTMKPMKCMTRKGYQKFKEEIEKEKISEIWEKNEEIHQIYTQWNKKIVQIKEECMTKITKKQTSKTRSLHKILKELKEKKKLTRTREEKEMISMRIKYMRVHIEEQIKKEKATKIAATVQKLRKQGGGVCETTFWEVKREIEGKRKEECKVINDKAGRKVSNKQEVLKVYEEFYEDLFKKPVREEKLREQKMAEFKDIISRGEKQEALIVQKNEVEQACKQLKKKKAQDTEGWKNELMIYGGEEMIRSLTLMSNKILREREIPEEWSRVIIKSLYKNKGSRLDMVNRRGLFLTNLVSKLFEKVLYCKSENRIQMPQCQNGGRKRRSAIDNLIIIMSIIDNNRRIGRKTYMVCADAEKCFDKLWLEDCLIDLNEIGMREREVSIIYKMNKMTKVIVNTPVGYTKEFMVEKVVKQGTIYAPILCCASTGKVNNMTPQPTTIIGPELQVQALVYVDDIAGAGNKNVIEGVVENLNEMEKDKGFTFATKKTNYMVIKTGKEKDEKVELSVKRGNIRRVEEYTYLGITITEHGTIEKHLNEKMHKGMGMIKDINKIGSEYHVGQMSTSVQLLLYEKTVIPSLTYNLEGITYWRKGDWALLERIQGKLLKYLLKMPESTPYWGLLNELGIWPLQDVINYKKFMLYQNIITSEEDRLCKKVIKTQKEYNMEGSWYMELEKTSQGYNIGLKEAETKKKSEWKKTVKRKIKDSIIRQSIEKVKEMKKLRHQKEQIFETQQYIVNTTISKVRDLIRTKLEMLDIGNNIGGGEKKCFGCNNYEERTEHLIQCEKVRVIMQNECDGYRLNTGKNISKVYTYLTEYLNWRNINMVET